MRLCVFGAGAIGGHIAARLAQSDAEVSVLARGAQLAAIHAQGLVVHAPDGRIAAQPRASDDPAALGPQDAVIVTVKAPALPAVAASIAPLLGPKTAVAFLMNGIPWWYFHAHGGPFEGTRLPRIDPEGRLWRSVGPHRALGGVVYSACTVVEPGVIRVEGPSRLVLGEPDGRQSDRLTAIVELLASTGIDTVATDRIRDALWSKLLLNLSTGPLCVLTAAALDATLAEPAVAQASLRLLAEGADIARRLGVEPRFDPERMLAGSATMTHRPSIVQDLALGRPMEIDALFGVPQDLGRMVGAETPTLDLVLALARIRAREAGLYGVTEPPATG